MSQYQATCSTSIEQVTGYRLLVSIYANSLDDAKKQIENVNKRWTDWDMVLHNETAFPDDVIMPIGLIDAKGEWHKEYPDWASLSTIRK